MAENDKMALLKKIQQYNFAAYDMLLYLDTHPNDKKAFCLYKELKNKYMELLEKYHKSYGPLTMEAIAGDDSFNWLNSPWPWECSANPENACNNANTNNTQSCDCRN